MKNKNKISKADSPLKPQTIIVDDGSQDGFLPIETNWFDRFFISIVIWVAMCLIWFRLLEPAGLSIWVCNAIALVLAIYIIRKG